jgi:hypothetical protein
MSFFRTRQGGGILLIVLASFADNSAYGPAL